MRSESGPNDRLLLTLLFAGLCLVVFLAFLRSGLWEDGYFFLRYARNTWRAGVAAWNVKDGPAHGMTSQAYQALLSLLYPLAPRRLVTISKLLSALSLFGAGAFLFRWQGRDEHALGRNALAFLGLGLPLVINHVTTGLETLLVLLWLALWVRSYAEFCAGRSRPAIMALFIVGTYLLRPDATLIPCVALLPCLVTDRRRTLWAFAFSALVFAPLLLFFRSYYGTALPLAFYMKSYWSNTQGAERMAIFWPEKIKNLVQFFYFYAPFLAIAWRGRATDPAHKTPSVGITLLGAALTFCAYHAFFTVETMGHFSRFYMPAVVPIIAAAMLGFANFRERIPVRALRPWVLCWLLGYAVLKVIDLKSGVYNYIPAPREVFYLAAMALLLLAPDARRHAFSLGAVGVLCFGILVNYRVHSVVPEIDRVILRRQIKKRNVFKGLAELAAMNPLNVYHTDMGAPGVLLPDATVTDIDGLLNEEMLLEHKSFAELCARDRPDAIFVPEERLYPRLRAEILASPCYREYRPLPAREKSLLAVRSDLWGAYKVAAAKIKKEDAAAAKLAKESSN